MFNVDLPTNVYSEEPTLDITFGVDNPSYVAMKEMSDNKEEEGNLYEIINISEDKTDQDDTKDDGSSPGSLSNVNIEIVEEGLTDIITSINKEGESVEETANEKLETSKESTKEDSNEKAPTKTGQGKLHLLFTHKVSQTKMLESCVAMETSQHSTSPNVNTFPVAEENNILIADDKSEIGVTNEFDDLGCIFGDPLVMPPPILEEGYEQKNEVGDMSGQTQEENNDDDGINLLG